MSKEICGKVIENMPLKKHTSWRVGGPAKQFYSPSDIKDLAAFIAQQPNNEQIYWLGLGSNVLIRDGGFPGIVISTLTGLEEIEQVDSFIVRAEAGVPCAKLARHCARLNFLGGEFWAGIPGTVGGALAMNAGCFGSETWELVEAVETISRNGEIRIRKPMDYQVSYREVKGLENEWFVAGYFRLQSGDKETALENIRLLLERRAATQPTGDHSCGSVFRNPQGNYAAKLIESCGLKGHRIGQAQVSTKHANFIINEGEARAQDIEQLIEHVRSKVKETHDIDLIKEVKIIGDE